MSCLQRWRRKLVKKCLHHNGGVYALTTNRIVLPRKADLAAPFLGLTAQMESSKTVIDRVMKANVPDNGLDRSPLRLGRGTPPTNSPGSPAAFGMVTPIDTAVSPPRLATTEPLHGGDEAGGADAADPESEIPTDTPCVAPLCVLYCTSVVSLCGGCDGAVALAFPRALCVSACPN